MDPTSERAGSEYDGLLRDQSLVRELEERFLARMRERGLTFGPRVVCSSPRPNLVSPELYDRIRAASRHVLAAVFRVEEALGPALWDRVGLRPDERELARIDPGYRRASPLARLDAFLTPSGFRFVELNAETPAGGAYADVLSEVFLEIPLVRRFQERWRLRRFDSGVPLLRTILGCYHEAGGRKRNPAIAVVDYADVPTRAEHELVRARFESLGCPALVCDPRALEYRGGTLRHDGVAIDVVYKRLLVSELLERRSELTALVAAARDRAVVVVNPFRCKPLHKKSIFAVLGDDAVQSLLSAAERQAIREHVPWTRRVAEGFTTWGRERVDLPRFVLSHREGLVLKPNDEYGGKGVLIGPETGEADWARGLEEALAGSYVVQERVELPRQEFPEMLETGGRARLGFREFVVDLDPYLFDGEVEGFLTRLGTSSLANVTSGGGQVPSFLVEPVA